MSDWEFIFDGVFGFLTSPLWEVPIMSFIETQSIVFEPSEENAESWKEIHEKYKSMIESLLSSYLSDVGITEVQFMRACGSPSARNAPQMQPVYEQLWATEDYEIFKRMMIQRNVELQLQALELIKKRQKKASVKQEKETKSQQSESRSKAEVSKTEEEILEEVIKKSEEEYKNAEENHIKTLYDPSLEAIISESTKEQERLEEEITKSREQTKQTVITGLLAPPEPVSASSVSNSISHSFLLASPEPVSTSSVLSTDRYDPPLFPQGKRDDIKSTEKAKEKELKALRNAPPVALISAVPLSASEGKATNEKKGEDRTEEVKKPHDVLPKPITTEPSKEELLKRAEYLRQQRDRLLALKKEEREKKLSEYTKDKPERPSSARAARQAVSGDVKVAAPSEEDERRMAMRKALAEKLKREVVYK